jgi:hypothetical protein
MSCKIIFESNIKFREFDLLLKLKTSSINVEFYSLSNSFNFIISCYIEQKIYLFLWTAAISRFKCPKKIPTTRGLLALKSQYFKGPTMTPRLMLWCGINQCEVFVARRWQLATCQNLLQVFWPGTSEEF